MPFSMSKCAKGEKRKADDVDLSSSQPAPTKTPKVSEIKIAAPLSRRNPRSRPVSAPVQVSIYPYCKDAGNLMEDFKGGAQPLWQVARGLEIAREPHFLTLVLPLCRCQVQIYHNAQRDITFKLRA